VLRKEGQNLLSPMICFSRMLLSHPFQLQNLTLELLNQISSYSEYSCYLSSIIPKFIMQTILDLLCLLRFLARHFFSSKQAFFVAHIMYHLGVMAIIDLEIVKNNLRSQICRNRQNALTVLPITTNNFRRIRDSIENHNMIAISPESNSL